MKDTINNFDQLLAPDAVEFSFDTTGWKVLAGVAVVLIILIIIGSIRRVQKNRYRKEALLLMREVHGDTVEQLREINRILRRTAYTASRDPQVKQISGKQWCKYLLSHTPPYPLETDFIEPALKAIYQPDNNINEHLLTKYHQYAIFWIRKHEF
ncbi:DUF4381 domain-containing protein [Halosquirtibacter laminarini]|uniref:DUF4381 domain-containing protein n=1 Tax=Halosquirtibacter laminarini TaxID=3374600 RepID=A0AC61NBH0_9BACT|nr:DUF4381 domain-containing protein [Prolixibacteraceae bacterium]